MSDEFDVPPEHVTTGQLYMLLQQLSTKQSLILKEQLLMSQRMQKQESATEDMVAAWRVGGTVLRLIKWAALVGGAVVSVWKFMKGAG